MSKRIAVVGAGTMGAGIAQSAAAAGYEVRLFDANSEVVAAAVGRIGASFAKRLGEAAASAATARLIPSAALADLADCELVIEAIIEVEEAKKGLFKALSDALPRSTVLASNTSCLSVSALAEAVAAPERFVGLHYFFPAAINPLLEVIAGDRSGEPAMQAAFAFGRATGKQPIRCADVYGFAVNRYFVPYLNEAVRLMDEGIPGAEVERCARRIFGTKAGPFKVMDLTKPEIALHSTWTLAKLSPFYAPAKGLVAKGEARESWNLDELPDGEGSHDGLIRERMLGAVFKAVREELGQKVATPEDIDLGARIGLQWAMLPCAEMAKLGEKEVERLVGLV